MKIQSQQKLKFKQSVYNIVLFSLIVVVLWIGFEIYFAYNQGRDDFSENIIKKVDPVTSNLHLDLAQTLQSRQSIDPAILDSFAQSSSSNQIPAPTLSPSPTINQTTPL